ncbi:heavy-metal-associated domain-containing protein [Massilia sp. P8910]|uniref:heavy-metal-associated domain-containing protein n=1 Tax=Massilia antarctica TaxID=2765360 RepID=UPI001E3BF344|nr:heavy-metal-associated domain-containing protein [Massilia antarctica]MCE3607577.1 heavy-metal-associated domain-containing protein [Massilia antarctica]
MIELQVERMTCGGCANSVKRSILAVDPHATVGVDLGSKKVQIESAASVDAIKAAISGAGYPVAEITQP